MNRDRGHDALCVDVEIVTITTIAQRAEILVFGDVSFAVELALLLLFAGFLRPERLGFGLGLRIGLRRGRFVRIIPHIRLRLDLWVKVGVELRGYYFQPFPAVQIVEVGRVAFEISKVRQDEVTAQNASRFVGFAVASVRRHAVDNGELVIVPGDQEARIFA